MRIGFHSRERYEIKGEARWYHDNSRLSSSACALVEVWEGRARGTATGSEEERTENVDITHVVRQMGLRVWFGSRSVVGL